MGKIVCAVLLFASSHFIYGQDTTVLAQDSISQLSLYNTLKPEFEKYEKQHGKFIQTKNVNMHYLEWGNPKNPTLVWVHGTYSNGYELYEIVDELVHMNLHVIAIDYYGHGFTKIPKKEVSIYDVADDIKFLLDRLHIKKAIIGGWSRGGSISTAFYDAYPECVQALILEDGGSVAWDTHVKQETIQKDLDETKKYYLNKPLLVFNAEFEVYRFFFNDWGFKRKEGSNLNKETFNLFAQIKKNSEGKFERNPGAHELTGENTADENNAIIYTPFTAKSSFGASTHQLNPKIIYRNLHIPLLIFDPISSNDWFDFIDENTNLTQEHQPFITHKVYEKTWHGVKDQHPQEVLKDTKEFLNTNKITK